ncbi:hypothetical protein Syun_007104 [Stephania yunnanensis]|uniref:Uncharacterized protein n=1 Tax=Stephania yunnanensis TaxID=152371 RepID=A0AAP0PYB5_9MAGN
MRDSSASLQKRGMARQGNREFCDRLRGIGGGVHWFLRGAFWGIHSNICGVLNNSVPLALGGLHAARVNLSIGFDSTDFRKKGFSGSVVSL